MHEFSVISSIVDTVKAEMEKRPVVIVKQVNLEVGDLTFLAHEALRFGFTALVENEPRIANDALNIVPVEAEVKCKNCNYEGPMVVKDSEAMHTAPIFKCPKCDGQIEIIRGRECTVVNLRMEVED